MHIITGGAGFIGSVLLRELNNRGLDNIVIVDHLGSGEKWRNLVKGHYADYFDRDEFLTLAKSGYLPFAVKSLTHLGACSSTTEVNADFLMANNFHYSQAMCKLALKHNARFICASSAATYGDGSNGFSDDLTGIKQLRPLNMYGYSKHLFDLWLMRKRYLSRVTSLKFFNVYGPNEYHKGNMRSVASKLFDEISDTGVATLFASQAPDFADGEQKRDFVYVKDCAKLLAWLLLDAPQVTGIGNVGTGQAASFNDVAQAVFVAMGRQKNIQYTPMPASLAPKYQNYTQAETNWLRSVEYPHSFVPVQEGVRDYVVNYLATDDKYV